jgi:hypothetical protein
VKQLGFWSLQIAATFAAAAGAFAGCDAPETLPRDDGAVIDANPLLPDAAQLTVELGTGATEFTPVTDGEMVDLVLGPQGGYHIWTAVRVHDPAIDRALVNVTATFEDDGQFAGAPIGILVPLDLSPEGTRCYAGLTSFIDSPAAASGRRVVLSLTVMTNTGGSGRDERVVVPR